MSFTTLKSQCVAADLLRISNAIIMISGVDHSQYLCRVSPVLGGTIPER